MARTATISLNKSTKELPYSKMVYPRAPIDKVKYVAWRIITPAWPFFRDTCVALRVVTHDIRQPFLIGRLIEGKTVEELIAFLVSQGYGNHFVAWKDKGEVLGLRRADGFSHQYHIRLFEDGEVRGHYEYTPESYPILHLKGIGQEDRTREFRELLEGWLQ